MLAETEALLQDQERHPPLEIFCPFCQPNLRYFMLFPQTAERKMRQAFYAADGESVSIIYSCQGCLEIYMTRNNGTWHVRPIQGNGHSGRIADILPQDYKEYLRRIFGEYELINGKN